MQWYGRRVVYQGSFVYTRTFLIARVSLLHISFSLHLSHLSTSLPFQPICSFAVPLLFRCPSAPFAVPLLLHCVAAPFAVLLLPLLCCCSLCCAVAPFAVLCSLHCAVLLSLCCTEFALFAVFSSLSSLLSFSSLFAVLPSDVIGLDWSWIQRLIQSNPERRKFRIQCSNSYIWFSACLNRFSIGSERALQSNRAPIQ